MSHKYDGALLSFGAGVNSTAMAIMLVNEGWRGPIVFADTGCEWPETYCFMDYFEGEWLRPRGLEITRLGAEWRRAYNKLPLIAHCETKTVIPLAAMRWCTDRYKIQPMKRWAKQNGIEMQLLGIAADEAHRAQGRLRPLVERHIDRRACITLIEEAGLTVPRKSGCYICPFQRDVQWHELWKLHPGLFDRAQALEEAATARLEPTIYRGYWDDSGEESVYVEYDEPRVIKPRPITLDPGGRYTLRQRRDRYEAQLPLFDDAEMDRLLAYRPCVCGL